MASIGGSGRARHRWCPWDRSGDQHPAGRTRGQGGGRLLPRRRHGQAVRRRPRGIDHPPGQHRGGGRLRAGHREVLDQHGQLDILVNNAGITIDRTVRKMSVEDWDRVVHVNLSGAFYLSRAVLQHMLDRGYGRIINISSVIGEKGNIGQANYAAAGSGLFGLTNSLALETARKGITVNSVAPGFIATEMVSAMPEEVLAKVVAQIPVGRLGEPEEIARVVEFLADPDSGYITGEVYGINGGLYM